MDDKLQIIQLLIDTESPSILNKVKMLLLEKSSLELDEDYEVPQAIRDEIEKKEREPVRAVSQNGKHLISHRRRKF